MNENIRVRIKTKDRSERASGGYTWVSNAVMVDYRLSHGAKLTYFFLRMVYFKTKSISFHELSQFLGVKKRQTKSYVAELKLAGIITSKKLGRGKCNTYYFEELHKVYDLNGLPKKPQSGNILHHCKKSPIVQPIAPLQSGNILHHYIGRRESDIKEQNLPSVNSSQQPTEENAFPYLPEAASPPPLPPAPPPPNILACMMTEYEKATGGTVPFGRLGKAVAHVRKKHGDEKVKQQWLAFLAEVDPRYASPEYFARTFLVWGKKKQSKVVDLDRLMKLRRA